MPRRQATTSRKSVVLPSGWVRRFWAWTGGKNWFLRWFWRLGATGILLGLLMLLMFELYFGTLARRYSMDSLGTMPERSLVLNSRGRTIGKLHGENRLTVPKSAVAQEFIDALLSREDDRFYSHHGVDWVGVARATVRNLKDRRAVQGASTITMQLARNSFGLSEQKTIHRKLLEIAITQRIETSHSKDAILEAYMNRVFFGNGIYGIERASQAYFGKHASALRLDEAAMLAGIIRGPNKFSPFRNLKGAMAERDTVLDRMVEKGRINRYQASDAKSINTKVLPPPIAASQESYAMDAVRRDLDSVLDMDDMEDGGLKIYTTIDSELQDAAEAALEARLKAVENSSGYQHQTRAQFTAQYAKAGESVKLDYLQGAILLLENHTGAIRALVGGRDYAQSSYNRALSAKRQVGSTFKPLVYAAAIEKAGMLPEFMISDDPIQPGEIRSAEGSFSPQNSDGSFLGLQPMEFGLAKSRNTMTVRIGERAGMDNVIGVSDVAGIKDISGRSPQIYIGNLGATLKSITSAYSVFPNAGKRCRPFIIDRIENANGEILFRSGQIEYEVVSPGTAYLMRGMMQKVMQPGGTGAGIKQFGLKAPVGGKTGTTDDYKDAWFIGFNPSHTCGVWVGLDDPERIVGQGYGGRLAMPIWADVMKQIEKQQPDVVQLNFPRVALVEAEICPVSGQLAASNCPHPFKLNVPEDRVPSTYCQQHAGQPRSAPGNSPVQPASRSVWQRLKSIFE